MFKIQAEKIDNKKTASANIGNVVRDLDKIKPELYPFTGHPLKMEEEYNKNLYISLLFSIAAYDGDIANSESNYIRRIFLGAKAKEDFDNLVKQGVEITHERMNEFIRAFSEKELAKNFIVDAIILACCDGDVKEKELEIIAELSEVLKIKKPHIEQIARLAAVILEQDIDEFVGLKKTLVKTVEIKNFAYYLSDFVPKSQLNNAQVPKNIKSKKVIAKSSSTKLWSK